MKDGEKVNGAIKDYVTKVVDSFFTNDEDVRNDKLL